MRVDRPINLKNKGGKNLNIINFTKTDRYFETKILCIIDGLYNETKYTTYFVKGINKQDLWEINVDSFGDFTNIEFNITDLGELNYNCPYNNSLSCYFTIFTSQAVIIEKPNDNPIQQNPIQQNTIQQNPIQQNPIQQEIKLTKRQQDEKRMKELEQSLKN
jgi:hypothetical protein